MRKYCGCWLRREKAWGDGVVAYKFTCPYCGKSEYSAWEHREEREIKCVYCGRKYPNPYYEEEENGDG